MSNRYDPDNLERRQYIPTKYKKILQNVRKLCEYTLDYCDDLTGCEKCLLNGITIDDGADCPIYIIGELNNKLAMEGVKIDD